MSSQQLTMGARQIASVIICHVTLSAKTILLEIRPVDLITKYSLTLQIEAMQFGLDRRNGYETRQSSFLFALDRVQNTCTIRVYISLGTTVRDKQIGVLMMLFHAFKTKDCARCSGPFIINLGIFVCSFEVYRA